jgi:hypothetical protein
MNDGIGSDLFFEEENFEELSIRLRLEQPHKIAIEFRGRTFTF